MTKSRNTGITSGTYTTIAKLSAVEHRNNTVVRLTTGERYSVDAADLGNGVLLPGGNYANPISDPLLVQKGFTNIGTATALEIGEKYLSTATATHTVPSGTEVGDEIQTTWAEGTTMTLNSVSNISVVIQNTKTTDTNWVFTNYISLLTLVWDGAEWEIK